MENEYILHTEDSKFVVSVCDKQVDKMLSDDKSLVTSVKTCISSIHKIFKSNKFDIISFEDVNMNNEIRHNILIIFETDKEDIKDLYDKYDNECWSNLPSGHKKTIYVTNC